jgi:hypothetical protein
MNALTLRIRSVQLYERPVVLRLPFRFGAATVTRCPQAFVRIEADAGGKRTVGATAELMVPKWFDKSPGFTHEQNFEQLRLSLRVARDAYLAEAQPLSPHDLSLQAGDAAVERAVALGLPRLAAQFGAAELDKAVADAALRAAGLDFVDGLRAGVLGDPHSPKLALQAPSRVNLRHTVGMADRLTEADPGNDPRDGLPATLDAAIADYGLRYFKLKLAGQAGPDLDRLARIASVLEANARDWHVTLDGNETFDGAEALGAWWRAFLADPRLRMLRQRTLLLEQPLARRVALAEDLRPLDIGVPVILDESDDHPDVFERGLALGYRGISSKACKGMYRSLANAVRVAREPQRLLLSGEDLTCQAGLAVQQDTLLAASLGVAHVERNGHHYVRGFGAAPGAEARVFAAAHPTLYRLDGDGAVLDVRDGRLDLSSLHVPGFASAAQPSWKDLTPLH